ncbi:unnamed protein product [Miscanthus lutarioriparius]|uniref:DUF7597 domain-containing protein n=1 Tax=Miscanthus lutarioriparius TaxID=422564 RepID=A0A811N1U3_9POAL|nr:unnamed protein product [Miscanthus lutarioriparius]
MQHRRPSETLSFPRGDALPPPAEHETEALWGATLQLLRSSSSSSHFPTSASRSRSSTPAADSNNSSALLADEEDEDVAAALDPLLTVATTTASATEGDSLANPDDDRIDELHVLDEDAAGADAADSVYASTAGAATPLIWDHVAGVARLPFRLPASAESLPAGLPRLDSPCRIAAAAFRYLLLQYSFVLSSPHLLSTSAFKFWTWISARLQLASKTYPRIGFLRKLPYPRIRILPIPIRVSVSVQLRPEPFMPLGAQRRVVHGKPVMRRVVIGHVPQRSNDLAVAYLQPMPLGPINFMAVHNIIEDFLRNRGIGFRSLQPCPFGQAYVRFNYIFERDLLIQEGPHHYGNGTISFVPQNKAWNNRTAIMTHEARMLGGAAEDEQFPPDDNDFDPYNFHFHGFGQMGHGPPPSPEQHIPVPPNIDILAAMGWEQWQNQRIQPPPEIHMPVEEVVQAEGHPGEVQNLKPLQVEEVQLEDLVDFNDLVLDQPLPPQQFEIVQLGFVDTFIPPVDPMQHLGKAALGPSPDAVRLWTKFFSCVDQSLPTVTIPTQLMNLFTLLMMKQSSFEWAKSFLQSPAWQTIAQSSLGKVFSFALPRVKPSVIIIDITCSDSDRDLCPEPVDTGFIDATDVVNLPDPSRLRDLGTSFCKLNPDTLTDEKLTSKPSKKGAVGRPQAKKPKQSREDPAEGSKKKESKK